MFFRRKTKSGLPKQGSLHVHRQNHRIVEKARVEGHSTDGQGIPHVTYACSHVRLGRDVPAGLRTLSLAAFTARFTAVYD